MSTQAKEQMRQIFALVKMVCLSNNLSVGITEDREYLVFFSAEEYEKRGFIPDDNLVINIKNLVTMGEEQ